jgi:hypothetical protein
MSEYGFDALRERRCECGAAACTAVIQISWHEADLVDHHLSGRQWLVAPGHEPQGGKGWRVVKETERFVVVEIAEEDV